MNSQLRVSNRMSKACKLCHGPLSASVAVPASPAMQSTASRMGSSIPEAVDCHAHCLSFACPGCVAKDKPSYTILNLKNEIYDYHCHECMADVPLPPKLKGLVNPALDRRESAPAGGNVAVC